MGLIGLIAEISVQNGRLGSYYYTFSPYQTCQTYQTYQKEVGYKNQ
jgi:hypothetical protein